jgi:hypothetical protein
MNNKTENGQIESKIRFISLINGLVDLSKFEIETKRPKAIYKIIREGN